MPGPRRIPTSRLKLTGSRLAKRREQTEPELPAGAPPLPDHLDERAREEWHRLVPLLLEHGVLTIVDGSVLAAHCTAVSDVERLLEQVRELGEVVTFPSGAVQRHPLTVLLREARTEVTKTAALLGMTPADRSKVSKVERPRVDDPAEQHFQ